MKGREVSEGVFEMCGGRYGLERGGEDQQERGKVCTCIQLHN